MKKITIAYDCDGTLVTTDSAETKKIVANERVRRILIDNANSKNVRTIVWSGGGELWARQVGSAIGIDKYVDEYRDKHYMGRAADGTHMFNPGIKPDICYDDIHACELGHINIIVYEK